MTTFADDFERADGPIGNGWSTTNQGCNIAGGVVVPPYLCFVYRELFTGGSVQRIRFESMYITSPVYHPVPLIKMNSARTNRYQGGYTHSAGNVSWQIVKYKNGVPSILATVVSQGAPLNQATIELVYDAGTITLLCEGVPKVSAEDTEWAANYQAGFYCNGTNTRLDDFYADDTPAQTFDAEPEPLVEMAVPEEVTFTGTDTAWEPGTPGQPIFEVDKGTLDSQTVTSATTASAMYTPPQAEDVATFTDPSTGLSDQIALSTGFQVDAGEGLSEDAVAYIEASAAQNNGSPGVILSTSTPITPYGTGISLDLINARLYAWVNTMAGDVPQAPPTMSLFDTLWWILNGHGDVDEDHNVFDYANTAAVESTNAVLALSAIRTDELYTIQTILDAIAEAMPTDIQPILDELAAIRTGQLLTLADPIAAVEAARGSGLPTIHDVLDELDTIRSPLALTLADLRALMISLASTTITAINNVSSQVTGVMNRLINTVEPAIRGIRGADNVDLTQLHDQTGQLSLDMVSHFGHVDTAIAGVRGLYARDLTEVYDAILALPQEQVSLQPVLNAISALSASVTQSRDAILAAIAAIRPADYPLWPGAGAAELGVPVSGSGDLSIPGPLDGLLVDVTSYPTEIRAWTVAGRVGLKWAGHVTFVSDIGYTEEIQFPGTDKRVLVPKSMLTCASALVHLRPGVQATVTPWYYAP